MDTMHQAAKFAKAQGFTHLLASDGTTRSLELCNRKTRPASFQFVGGIGWIICLENHKGYYEVISVINGYTARYNPSFNRFIAAHDEIGAGLGEFETLKDFQDYAQKG
jgi:hypothetical protein